jgi:hypothetical protein
MGKHTDEWEKPMRPSHRKLSQSLQRYPEHLEPRNLLSAVSFGAGLSTANLHSQTALLGPTIPGSKPSCATTQGTVLSAQLTDSAGTATGMVSYRTCTANGSTTTEFKVEVRGAAANTTLDVSIGDVVVGQVTTDSDGNGRLILSSNPKNSNEQALPENFPTSVAAGASIAVGTLTGSLATSMVPPRQQPPDGGQFQGTVLSTKLADTSSPATGMAMYRTETVDGVTTTEFEVDVRGAAANVTLDVSIDGTVVGQLTTDENGAGRLVLSSNPKNANEQALPENFPTSVAAGTSVAVGTLTGSLTTDVPRHGRDHGPPPPPSDSGSSSGSTTTTGTTANTAARTASLVNATTVSQSNVQTLRSASPRTGRR